MTRSHLYVTVNHEAEEDSPGADEELDGGWETVDSEKTTYSVFFSTVVVVEIVGEMQFGGMLVRGPVPRRRETAICLLDQCGLRDQIDAGFIVAYTAQVFHLLHFFIFDRKT
jgi:hypothetical protein